MKVTDAPAPGAPVLYALLNADGRVLYVGQTTNLRSRLRHHSDKPWRHEIARVEWLDADADETQRRQQESTVIHDVRPLYNVRCNYGRGDYAEFHSHHFAADAIISRNARLRERIAKLEVQPREYDWMRLLRWYLPWIEHELTDQFEHDVLWHGFHSAVFWESCWSEDGNTWLGAA